MRKRVKTVSLLVILIMIAALYIFSKFMPSGQDFKKLTPPKISTFNLTGTWRVIEKYNYKEGRNLDLKDEHVYLDQNRMFINNDLYEDVKYKLRIVDLKNYLSTEYNVSYTKFSKLNKEVDLISPLNDNTLIGEIIRLEDNKLLIIISDVMYTLTNISKDVSNFPINNEKYEDGTLNKSFNDIVECAYIGLKKNREIDGDEVSQESYRTLWIGVENGEVEPVYERDNILYPRLRGFWELIPERIKKNGVIREYFNTYNIVNKDTAESRNFDMSEQNKYLDLNFISNNYISVEEFTDKYSENNSRYKILPVDNINTSSGVSIDVLAGAEGNEALKNSSEVALGNLENYDADLKDKVKLDPTNIGVTRKNGRWVLEGRTKLDDERKDLEFDINMINTKKLIIYDNLYVRWNIAKMQNPLIKDIYTSPNGRIAIVVMDDYILVYEIENSQLKGDPIKKIKKDRNESVVMAEWTSGYIVDSWEKVFKQNATEVKN